MTLQLNSFNKCQTRVNLYFLFTYFLFYNDKKIEQIDK